MYIYTTNLSHISITNPVTLFWVPGHSKVEGNEIADRLARRGACGISNADPISLEDTPYSVDKKELISLNLTLQRVSKPSLIPLRKVPASRKRPRVTARPSKQQDIRRLINPSNVRLDIAQNPYDENAPT